MQLFVGNLSFAASEADVRKLFERFGAVVSVTVLMNKKGKKSRGFGFVEIADEPAARSAIAGLDAQEFMGRALKVMVARPRPAKEPEAGQDPRMARRPEFPDREFNRGKELKERPVRFKGGRRSRSYLRKITGRPDAQLDTIREESPASSWKKRRSHSRSWERVKTYDRAAPWKKSENRFEKPWQKPAGPAGPRQRKQSQSKPWQKSAKPASTGKKFSAGAPGPGRKSSAAPRSRFKARPKTRSRFKTRRSRTG